MREAATPADDKTIMPFEAVPVNHTIFLHTVCKIDVGGPGQFTERNCFKKINSTMQTAESITSYLLIVDIFVNTVMS